ncbi:MAG: alanine--tRNA ligase, partial [Gemmatimonadota bacterium]
AFLLTDGVFPSNEGRGYVLRRILRRAVRHAWMLGRREPTLVEVVDVVIREMAPAFPELQARREHLLRTTRAEEERFLGTIEGGLARFEELAPVGKEEGDDAYREESDPGEGAVISGEETFRLYDTFGFPLDLTELMARERGYQVDREGFREALEAQRERSRADRAQTDLSVGADETLEGWKRLSDRSQEFVGYDAVEVETEVLALNVGEDRVSLLLRENPFYAESGGQVPDRGTVEGDGWSLEVRDVRTVQGETVVEGIVTAGTVPSEPSEAMKVRARVPDDPRHDTERNHTATHLLHAALREVLGEHVVQRGSLVAPDRLRFDFAHTSPMTPEERAEVEDRVNREIWADHPVHTQRMPYPRAIRQGAMALFGEKYGEEVRVVEVPGVSLELCGGTHCRHTGEIGLFRIVSETGVAAGVRRIEAVTGPEAFRHFQASERLLEELASMLKARPENLRGRLQQLLEEKESLEALLKDLRKGGSAGEEVVAEEVVEGGRGPARLKAIRLMARDPDDVRSWGDGYREGGPRRVAVVAAELPGGKHSIFTFVSDDLIVEGVRADALVREVASRAGGKGGGRPHMAQAGVGNPGEIEEALKASPEILRNLMDGAS